MGRSRRIAKSLGYLVYCAFAVFVCFAAIEVAVRVFFTDVNVQGIEKALFRDAAFGTTLGLSPNITSSAFGIPVRTDDYGFLELPGAPTTYRESWLMLGDSVTFGVGVPAGSSFLGLLQKSLPDIKILNTSVPGYSAVDYANVLPSVLESHEIDRVILFWCLNDVDLTVSPEASLGTKVRDFLKTRSKAYMWLKARVGNRSDAHFRAVLATYQNEEFEAKTRSALAGMRDLLRNRGKELTVFILPYEYQLRADSDTALAPQARIERTFSELGIDHYDLFPDLAESNEESELYLTADGIHFSERGHERVFEILQRSLSVEPSLAR